jgi:hypothetical protein
MGKLFYPNIAANGIIWLLGIAMQLGGWINRSIAWMLIAIAAFWTIATAIYYVKHRRKASTNITGRVGIRMRGGSGKFTDTEIENMDVGLDTNGTDIKVKNTRIK